MLVAWVRGAPKRLTIKVYTKYQLKQGVLGKTAKNYTKFTQNTQLLNKC